MTEEEERGQRKGTMREEGRKGSKESGDSDVKKRPWIPSATGNSSAEDATEGGAEPDEDRGTPCALIYSLVAK